MCRDEFVSVQSSMDLWSLKLLTGLATLYVGVGDRSNGSICLSFVYFANFVDVIILLL